MSRPQFTLRALLVLMLSAGCFFGGIRFERWLHPPLLTMSQDLIDWLDKMGPAAF
jgi:hypothetical protein